MQNERDKSSFLYAGVGFAIAFAIFLVLGVLDHYKYLDPILDFLHVP